MVQQTKLTTFLAVGAGAGLVAAAPHPHLWNPYKHHHGYSQYSFSGFTFPTETPSAYSSEGGSSLAAPTGFSSFPFSGFPSGTAAPTGTGGGFLYSTGSVFPTGTGGGFPTSSAAATSYSFGGGVLSSSPVVSAVVPSASSSGVGSVYDSGNSSSIAATAAGTSSVSVASASAASGCTFTDASSAESGKGNCKTIILSGIAVPAGTTLDMTDLNDGTTVQFEGTTTFGYEEWDGPLISFSGSGITITGTSGHVSGITSYGILIEQNYDGGDLDGTPTTGIPITELTLSNVKGTVSGGDDIAIVCGSSSSCSDWTWTDVSVTGGDTYGGCENVPSVASC